MQSQPARHWLRTLLPADASCPAADAPDRPQVHSTLRQVMTTYTAGVTATLAFIA